MEVKFNLKGKDVGEEIISRLSRIIERAEIKERPEDDF